MECPICHNVIKPKLARCPVCSSDIAAYANSSHNEKSTQEIACLKTLFFVFDNDINYMGAFNKIKNSQSSFNWAAFGFSVFWLAYRKMFFESIILTLFFITLFDCEKTHHHVKFGSILGQMIFLGINANKWYYSKLTKFLKKNNDKKYEELIVDDKIKAKYSGTSDLNVLLLIIISICYHFMFKYVQKKLS